MTLLGAQDTPVFETLTMARPGPDGQVVWGVCPIVGLVGGIQRDYCKRGNIPSEYFAPPNNCNAHVLFFQILPGGKPTIIGTVGEPSSPAPVWIILQTQHASTQISEANKYHGTEE